jgi:hypothetical protein
MEQMSEIFAAVLPTMEGRNKGMAKNSKQSSQPPIEFTVPEELRKCGISRIVQVGPFIKTLYKGVSIPANFDVSKLKKFADELREEAGKIITSNGIAANEIIEKLIFHVISEATDRYEKDLAEGKIKITTTVGNGKAQQQNTAAKEAVTTMKYTSIIKKQHQQQDPAVLPQPQLWETVRIGGKYYLVSYDGVQNKIVHTESLPDITNANRTILPFNAEGAVEHFAFDSFEELQQIVQTTKLHTASTLFLKVKDWASKFYDTDTEEYINLIAADIVFTYFQDRIGITHYIFVHGDPDQGKGAILETFNQLAYRGASVASATPATIYRMLGTVEKGQITLIIDEANRLEDDDFMLTILKVGYKGNAKVPRSVDSQSSDAKIEHFYAFGFKIIAAEKLPARWKTGGFLSRCLKIKTAPGDPKLVISEIVDNAGDTKNAKIMQELARVRKLLFAYRLLHYSEPIPDIRIKEITGRDRELIKPLLRLFNTHGSYDNEVFDTIKKTLHYYVRERNEDRIKSFEAAVLNRIKTLIERKDTYELPFIDIWEDIKFEFRGEPIEGKKWTLETGLFGEVGSKRLSAVLRGIGGKSDRDSSGDRRVWKFNARDIDRFSRVYKQIPDTIEIEEEQTTLDSAMMALGGDEQNDVYNVEEELENDSK